MKFIISIAVLILFSFGGQSQGLAIVDSNLTLESEVGSQLSSRIKVQNISNHTIILGIKKIENNIRSSQISRFCLDNNCTDTDIISNNKIIKLRPGQIYGGFITQLETGLVPGTSSVKYIFYNITNPKENIEAEINYTIKEKIKVGILFASNDVELRDVFPNPVTEKAVFNYDYLNPNKTARIVIHSVLGSVISEFNLSPYETRLTVPIADYNPGVYFYTLYIDNVGVATKKMVVRK